VVDWSTWAESQASADSPPSLPHQCFCRSKKKICKINFMTDKKIEKKKERAGKLSSTGHILAMNSKRLYPKYNICLKIKTYKEPTILSAPTRSP
jgi:hypothetical protein